MLRSALASFAELVGSAMQDEQIDLARGALAIARTEYAELDPETYLARLDNLSRRVRSRLPAGSADSIAITIAMMNRVLFDEEGFRANREDYYDPRNSFLNQVLDRKLGIPITLSLVYLEVGRRLGFPLFGVGMPGHFLLKHYEPDGVEILIDPYERGRIVTPDQCQVRLNEIYGARMHLQPEFLVSVSRRQILTRMLNNLRSIYMTARNFRKALEIVEFILTIYPRSPEDVKQRALLRHSAGDVRGALADLEDYLKMSPDASDADEIRQSALSLRRSLAMMN